MKTKKSNPLQRIRTKASIRLISLQKTADIRYQNNDLPQWDQLADMYAQSQEDSGSDRAIVSILNAIMTQQRAYFCFTRQQVMNLVKSDPNWKKSSAFRPNDYKKVKSQLLGSGFIKEIHKGSRSTASAFELMDPEWRSFLGIDEKAQKEEALAFAEGLLQSDESNVPEINLDSEDDVSVDSGVFFATVKGDE